MCTELWRTPLQQCLPWDAHYLKTRPTRYRENQLLTGIEEDQIITEHEYDYIQVLKTALFL